MIICNRIVIPNKKQSNEHRNETECGENPKGNKEIWESIERCRLLSF